MPCPRALPSHCYLAPESRRLNRRSRPRAAEVRKPPRFRVGNVPARVFASAALVACAESALAGEASADPQVVVPGERLSDWMLRQPGAAFHAGAGWFSPTERAAQQALRDSVVERLRRRPPGDAAAAALADWLQSLPITGRVAIALPDPRWLQAHPPQDPRLAADDSVRAGPRPATVTLVEADGRRCQVPHRSGATARGYLAACRGDAAGESDWAWLAQPDGRSTRVGLAAWNAGEEDEPAPGSWIWAPPRSAGHDTAFSQALIRFLGTQGPAVDAGGGSAAAGAVPLRSPLHRAPVLSASDWGEIGLLQTPTARMAPVGAARFHFSRVEPYTRGTVMFQPFDWLEAGFRYTDIGNRVLRAWLSRTRLQGQEHRSQVARWKESSLTCRRSRSALRDIGGTGLFSGEYVVANKRINDFDCSLGLGWGYAGGRGDIRNPLSVFGSGFDTRPVRLPPGRHGQLQELLPRSRGAVRRCAIPHALGSADAEDRVRRQRLPQRAAGQQQAQRSPINVGVVYRPAPGVDFSASASSAATGHVRCQPGHRPRPAAASPRSSDPPAAFPS